MENDMPSDTRAPAADRDTLGQLRAQQIASLRLEAQIAVLQLQNAHKDEDVAAARKDADRYKAMWKKAENERAEVRAKYEYLKRRHPPAPPPVLKRKCDSEDTEPVSRVDVNGVPCLECVQTSTPCQDVCPSPLEPSTSQADACPSKASSWSADERDNGVWPQSPIVPPSTDPLSSNATIPNRSNDPRKRIKLDFTSPVLSNSSSSRRTPEIAPPPESNYPATTRFPLSARGLPMRPTPTPTPSFPLPRHSQTRRSHSPPPQRRSFSDSFVGHRHPQPNPHPNLGLGLGLGSHPPVR
ncbi:hypothetical protein C8R44DRAFT_879911 [Mycena epipterygia]|nr:hypothetical protein C8R44DRAFT_879911 [Mycena epipterygia]